jgi:hypothetical protein
MSAFYPFLQVKQNGRRTGAQPDSTTPLAGITHLVNDRLAPRAVFRTSDGMNSVPTGFTTSPLCSLYARWPEQSGRVGCFGQSNCCSFDAGTAGLNRYPCISLQPKPRSISRCISVSTPSAVVVIRHADAITSRLMKHEVGSRCATPIHVSHSSCCAGHP